MLIKVHTEPFRIGEGVQWEARMRLPGPYKELKGYGDTSPEAMLALQQLYRSWRATQDDAQNLKDQARDIEVDW